MATEILMPQMGESIAEGTITTWMAQVGDTIERDDPLLEISTDKVDTEIPAPASGVILAIHRQEGETVPVGDVLGLIGAEGEGGGEEPGAEAEAEAVAEETAVAAAEEEAEPEEDGGEMSLEKRLRKFSSPLVRKIAKEEGVDLEAVEGSGIHGRVTKKDILAYLERRASGELPEAAPEAAPAAPVPAAPAPAPGVHVPAAPAPAALAAPAAAAAPPAPRPAAGGDVGFHVPAYHSGENVLIEPMDRIRQRTAAHMVYSKATSAHVSTVFHVDMSKVAAARSRAKGGFQREVGTKLTFMPFIFQAVASALRQFPQMNAAVDGTNIIYKRDINLGMAVALPGGGLIVPVLKGADEKNLVGLARSANDLADRARTRALKPDEVAGGTFTITNPGVFGSQFGTPIINQPQVAILGIGTIEKRAIVVTDTEGMDALAIRTMCYFALTFDHRLIDGADADHFMNAIKGALETSSWEELDSYR
ncbi:MAG: dihydrolipoamide acetyltransferase family protein [Acidobacteriota bacterium]